MNFFSNPIDIINGKVSTPKIKIDNPKIAIRHIFASALAFYWKYAKGSPKYAKEMTDSEYVSKLDAFLRSDSPQFRKLKEFLRRIVPEDIQEYGRNDPDEIRIGLSSDAWVDCLLGDHGRFTLLK